MVMLLQRVDAEEMAHLVDDDEFLERLLFGDEDAPPVPDPRQTDLDKLWHGVHWLLTGSAEESADGLGAVLFGGAEVGEDLGYGPARLMRPAEVAAVYRALAAVPESELLARFDPVAMERAGVYPSGIWGRPEAFSDLIPALHDVVEQYAAAVAHGDGLLLVIQ